MSAGESTEQQHVSPQEAHTENTLPTPVDAIARTLSEDAPLDANGRAWMERQNLQKLKQEQACLARQATQPKPSPIERPQMAQNASPERSSRVIQIGQPVQQSAPQSHQQQMNVRTVSMEQAAYQSSLEQQLEKVRRINQQMQREHAHEMNKLQRRHDQQIEDMQRQMEQLRERLQKSQQPRTQTLSSAAQLHQQYGRQVPDAYSLASHRAREEAARPTQQLSPQQIAAINSRAELHRRGQMPRQYPEAPQQVTTYGGGVRMSYDGTTGRFSTGQYRYHQGNNYAPQQHSSLFHQQPGNVPQAPVINFPQRYR